MLRDYYDVVWGMLVTDERDLSDRISPDASQDGLSWATILRKRDPDSVPR